MLALVYHAVDPTFGMTEKKFPDGYELVAKVQATDLEKAFELTNHIDCEWWDNEGVELVKKSRSTSVGDVVQMGEELFLCANVGWVSIPAVPSKT